MLESSDEYAVVYYRLMEALKAQDNQVFLCKDRRTGASRFIVGELWKNEEGVTNVAPLAMLLTPKEVSELMPPSACIHLAFREIMDALDPENKKGFN